MASERHAELITEIANLIAENETLRRRVQELEAQPADKEAAEKAAADMEDTEADEKARYAIRALDAMDGVYNIMDLHGPWLECCRCGDPVGDVDPGDVEGQGTEIDSWGGVVFLCGECGGVAHWHGDGAWEPDCVRRPCRRRGSLAKIRQTPNSSH